MMSTCRPFTLILLSLLLSACSLFERQPEPATPQPAVVEVVPQEPAAAQPQAPEISSCEQPIVKEVIKYVEKACPSQQKSIVKKAKAAMVGEKQVIGRVEYVSINNNGIAIKSRIDTGAKTSSLNAQDLSEFERDGKKWVRFAVLNPKNDEEIYFEKRVVRFVRIKQQTGDLQRRPVIKMPVKLGDVTENIELTLTDRSDYLYQVLVGRNYLLDRFLVDVSQKYTAKK
ncbi:ATP-dependent zinc protease [Dasania sp. GY-MA-18]|uniref:ATP-dependent zinc protease n=1 Tax=Dasania phycosphaerae TaxID=2950436 RepID=A0A9J6RJ92_9GAMM|nr:MULTISPECIES: ATP-dependent zinc protease [Dasania]MCR8922013.1 ATP-dependent zinc protease [Dasania sp. GY-MA-18]MCZ0864441.1 ATP-dependent zinc protease [Dasania phycosphaerae]MCZ0868169.1 ATP-dependent zinc protease [Dasania phycosphaerae]